MWHVSSFFQWRLLSVSASWSLPRHAPLRHAWLPILLLLAPVWHREECNGAPLSLGLSAPPSMLHTQILSLARVVGVLHGVHQERLVQTNLGNLRSADSFIARNRVSQSCTTKFVPPTILHRDSKQNELTVFNAEFSSAELGNSVAAQKSGSSGKFGTRSLLRFLSSQTKV